MVENDEDIILISLEGIVIRMHLNDINLQSRYGSGVRVMRLGEGDRIVTVACAERDDSAETAKPEVDPADTAEEAAAAAQEAAELVEEEQPTDGEE